MQPQREIVALERKTDWQMAGKRGQVKALVAGADKEAIQYQTG